MADNADLQEAHLRKCHYYNSSDIQQRVTGKFPGADTVQLSSVTLNWHGIESAKTLCRDLGHEDVPTKPNLPGSLGERVPSIYI